MKNNILFLSLTLLFILPIHAENPDPNDWFNDSMDDDFDPNTQNVIKEIYSAITTRRSSSPTTQSPSSETKMKESRSKEEKEKQKRIADLEEYLATNQTKLDQYQNSLDELSERKRSCRRHEVGGLLVSTGAVGARYYDKITTLPAVIIGTIGTLYIVWNEASARRHGERAHELEKKIETNIERTHEFDEELKK